MASLGSWVGGSVGKGRREYSALAGSDGFNIICSVNGAIRARERGPRARGRDGSRRFAKTARASGAWRCRRMRRRADAAGTAALLRTGSSLRTAFYASLNTPVGNYCGRTRRPSPRHHSLAPCITAAACVRCLALAFAFRVSDSHSAPLTKSSSPIRKRYLTQSLPWSRASVHVRLKPGVGRLCPFSSRMSPAYAKLWLKLPAKPVWRGRYIGAPWPAIF